MVTAQGEIDILEGVNDHVPNESTLHSTAGCTMPASRTMTGWSVGNNCDVYATGNTACGVLSSDPNSYGPNFNDQGGGWYAIERTSNFISVYFWERNSPLVPNDVKYPGSSVDTDSWGTPTAYFPDTYCNFATYLGPMNIVIDLTLCGYWADPAFNGDGCPGSCIDYVNNNPGAFSNAYFEFNAINVYH
ncbi:hypothetical protein J3R82DRAFT_11073 [Butyriboletus roseoflavus]|nr:hypothetical protein J3R82DRAFT_11073 [Butyriboletus roseoflavus]